MSKKIYWLNSESRQFLSKDYLLEGQTAEERIRIVAESAERILGIVGFADKFESYMHKGWISLSTPVWTNFGVNRGLPISCNNSYFADDTDAILYKIGEIGMMTKHGAGTSAYISDLRPRKSAISTGGQSEGPVHFCSLIESVTNVISQSKVRRGSCAVYIDADHPDIMEFLELREPHSPVQDLSLGVCISDDFMNRLLEGDNKTEEVWLRILKKKFESGFPYLFWTDTVNNNAPQVYKDKGRKILGSNLCSEIALSSNEEESFVCNLSSINILHYDEWKDTDLVETMIYFLDAVLTEYIEKTKNIRYLEHAHNFAVRQRAVGLGVLGWASYLQSRMIPFDSIEAYRLNHEIFKLMDDRSLVASQELAKLFGEPEMLKGYGIRNVTRLAIAPTMSSSFILGQVSQGIEPFNSNYFTRDIAKGKFGWKNPYLKEVLKKYGKDDRETWKSILIKDGSVQHLEFLSDEEREVFKTFGEIDQMVLVKQAAHRQKYIDQAQSFNIMIHPDTPVEDLDELFIEMWKLGVKTQYYMRSTSPTQEFARNLLSCSACEA